MKKLSIIVLLTLCASGNNSLYANHSARYKHFQENLTSENLNPQPEDIDNIIALVNDLDELKKVYPKGEKLPLTVLEFLVDHCEYSNTSEITKLYYKSHGIDRNERSEGYVRTGMRIFRLRRKWDEKPDTLTKDNIFQCQVFHKFIDALRPNR